MVSTGPSRAGSLSTSPGCRLCNLPVCPRCRDYVAASFLPTTTGTYDYISVDGRVRMYALARALPLLKPEGGILLLDNSERALYQKAFQMVPSHWLMVRSEPSSLSHSPTAAAV